MKKDSHGLSVNIRVCYGSFHRPSYFILRRMPRNINPTSRYYVSTILAHQADASFTVRQSCARYTRRYSNTRCSIIMHTNAHTSLVNGRLANLRHGKLSDTRRKHWQSIRTKWPKDMTCPWRVTSSSIIRYGITRQTAERN